MFKHLLAASNKAEEVLASLRLPILASPKLDGIRGTNLDGIVKSRNLKPLPNELLQERFGWSKYIGYDGEFIVGDPTDKKCFNKTTSVVMSREKPIDDVRFFVFDNADYPSLTYNERRNLLAGDDHVVVIEQVWIHTLEQLLKYEETMLEAGYEGLILRDPFGLYKYGRSTLREGTLLKLKRFEDSEAEVIGFEERMHNANEKTLEKNGKAVRSSHQAGLVPLGTLGALKVRWCNRELASDVKFNIGSGFDEDEAQEIWNKRDFYLGRMVKFKYFAHGMKDAPRHPVFLGWRDDL